MTDTLSSMADKQLTPKRIVISFIVNAVINNLIAVILFAIGFGKDFVSTLVFSQCIGMSIYFANLAAVMVQFMSREIRNVVDLALRYTYGVEEHAGQVSTILEWQLSDRMQFFNINTISPDGGNNEFNSLFTKSFMAGIEYHF